LISTERFYWWLEIRNNLPIYRNNRVTMNCWKLNFDYISQIVQASNLTYSFMSETTIRKIFTRMTIIIDYLFIKRLINRQIRRWSTFGTLFTLFYFVNKSHKTWKFKGKDLRIDEYQICCFNSNQVKELYKISIRALLNSDAGSSIQK